MYLSLTKLYLFYIFCVITIIQNVEGYPSKNVDSTYSLSPSDNSMKNPTTYKESELRKIALSKRNVLNPVISPIPPETPNTNTSVSAEKKSSVKKVLPANETVVNAINLTTPSIESSTSKIAVPDSPSVKTNVTTDAPIAQEASKESSSDTIKSSTPIIGTPNVTSSTESNKNITITAVNKSDSGDGAKKRGLIVFGALGIFSAVYVAYKIYKRRKLQRNNDLSFYPNSNDQFKYGVLMSNENDDNLELTNIPQTIDSDDEEIEIFGIESKKFMENEGNNSMKLSSHIQTPKQRLLTKDDVEILDLNLPGTSSETDILRSSLDDNLLDFDDVQHKNVSVMHSTQSTDDNRSFKPKNRDDFFDIL